jgi:S-DNA-T family DNA segregation ATPase FtsK/SpoIIIE
MIQSGKFDSSKMNIKKIANTALQFTINRLIEILGLIILIVGLLLIVALASYYPSDPNFIFPENTEIKNLLGFQGSYISDLFFQSVGLTSYLISLTLIFTGINVFKNKDLFLVIENNFFTILYSILGSLFFSYFYENSFTLYINGSGGFIGNYFNGIFLGNLISLNIKIAYYFLIIITGGLFLTSINFNPNKLWNFLKKIFYYFNRNNNKPYTDRSEIISEYIPQDEIKNLIQEDLPFIKAEKIKETE